jgi:putative redox protein
MEAIIKQVDGITMVGMADSNVWITMDGPKEFGGSEAGVRPLELLLIGLGGCTGMDVISILAKKRASLDDFKVHIEADRTDEHPKIFTEIRMKYVFYGKELNPKHVEEAIALSQEKYCSASAMLKKACKIKHEYEIVGS